MITIKNRWQLRNQTAQFVLVKTEDKVYKRHGDEYIRKQWFGTDEAASILEVDPDHVSYLCRKMGLQARANKKKRLRISLQQLRQMAQTKNEKT
jgi:hypothetical protein